MEPLGLGPFLERDVNRAAHAAEELHERGGLGRQDRPRDHPSAFLADGGHRGGLMHIEGDILRSLFHEGRSGLGSMGR